nr:hypothetical protein [Tanacetum cinerariifolium]
MSTAETSIPSFASTWISNVARARETVGSTVVQRSGIQCYNCKEFRHVAKECQKPKRVKDAAYHREKMLLYQELEAHYMYMAQLQEVSPDVTDYGPIFDTEPVQKYFEIQDLKAQLQDKGIAISELKKLIEKLKGVIPTTSVSRPQLKSNPKGDRVLRSNSHGKKLEVEELHRNVKLSKNKTSVTACSDSLNAKTLNV